MAAGEQEAQDVVAILAVVEPVGERRFRIVEIGERLVVRQRLLPLLAPFGVDRRIAPNHDQPSLRIARRPVFRPGFEGPEAGLLGRLLGGVEITEIAQKRCDQTGPRGGEDRAGISEVAHAASFPGSKPSSGRIS